MPPRLLISSAKTVDSLAQPDACVENTPDWEIVVPKTIGPSHESNLACAGNPRHRPAKNVLAARTCVNFGINSPCVAVPFNGTIVPLKIGGSIGMSQCDAPTQ